MVHGNDFFIVGRQEGREHVLRLLRSAYELSKVVTLGPGPSQSRTATILGRTLTLRQWRIEYEPDQHVSRALKALGLTGAKSVGTPGTDDVGGPKASEISEMRKTAKWHNPPEEVSEEDDLLIGEELKLFQSVAARFNFLAMDRPDLLYSVKELMRKMASPRAQDIIALKRVARYTIKYPRMACRYPWTPLDSNIEVFGDANFAGCHSTKKSSVGGIVMWSGIRESVVQNYGSFGLEQRRIRIGTCGEGGNRRNGVAIDSERLLSVWSRGNQIGRNCRNWDGSSTWSGKSPTLGCGRLVGATSRSFRENSSCQNVRTGESERCTNQVSRTRTTVASHENVQLGSCC